MDYRWTKERVAEFGAERGRYPDYEFTHRKRGWEYLTHNPWGTWVSGNWHVDDDVHLLDVLLASNDQCDRHGLYACWYLGQVPYLKLIAITSDSTVSREAYEHWMERFHELITEDPTMFGPNLGTEFVCVGIANRKWSE